MADKLLADTDDKEWFIFGLLGLLSKWGNQPWLQTHIAYQPGQFVFLSPNMFLILPLFGYTMIIRLIRLGYPVWQELMKAFAANSLNGLLFPDN